jgi:hypothetical protein
MLIGIRLRLTTTKQGARLTETKAKEEDDDDVFQDKRRRPSGDMPMHSAA